MELTKTRLDNLNEGDLVKVKFDNSEGFWMRGEPFVVKGFVYESTSAFSRYMVVVNYQHPKETYHDFVVPISRIVKNGEEYYEYRTVTCAKDYRHALDEGWEYDCDKGNDIQMKRKVK